MANLKSVLVTTTPTVEGMKIKKYLKPVSAHIVAGTSLFSDFLASFSDVFGGRSGTYQKQLTSLYNEAIERVKYAAYEIGANCVVGLKIDMDEISGKGKSMLMLTAVGTAVIIEKDLSEAFEDALSRRTDKRLQNIAVDKINVLRNKKSIVREAASGTLTLNDEIWNFITSNQVDEVFPFLLKKFAEAFLSDNVTPGTSEKFYRLLLGYIDALPDDTKTRLLYLAIEREDNDRVVRNLAQVIKKFNLFDFDKTVNLLKNDNFDIQKRGIGIVVFDKPFYNRQDIENLKELKNIINKTFVERGTRSTKKQLLSSKEKEVWTCGCGKTNDIGVYCNGCGLDIYGFGEKEIKPETAESHIRQKIELISEYLYDD